MMLIIEPLEGLGNRMRALDSAQSLANTINRPLVVVWRRARSLGARFDELFERPPNITFSPPGLLRAPGYVLDQPRVKELKLANFPFEDLRQHPTVYIKTWERFFPSPQPFFFFSPIEPLSARIALLSSDFAETMGVHIRRTDHIRAIEGSPT